MNHTTSVSNATSCLNECFAISVTVKYILQRKFIIVSPDLLLISNFLYLVNIIYSYVNY